MTTQDTDRLMNDCRLRLPAATDGVIKHELFQVMDEFLKGSHVWQEDISITTTATGKTYEIEPEDNQAIIYTLMLVLNGTTQISASLADPTLLVLENEPGVVATYVATVALSVVDPVDSNSFPYVPDWVWQMYRGEIMNGVLARMMSQPAKPYSNTTLAAYHASKFRTGISFAKRKAWSKNLFAGQRWKFPQGFARGYNH